jgi:hypothetical protein
MLLCLLRDLFNLISIPKFVVCFLYRKCVVNVATTSSLKEVKL